MVTVCRSVDFGVNWADLELTYETWLHEPPRDESNLTVVILLTTILNSPKFVVDDCSFQ